MKRYSDRGSVTVFSALIIVAVLSCLLGLLLLVEKKVNKGVYEDAISISARSVLSEYNPYIKDRYGIFVLNKDLRYLDRSMNFFLQNNISKKKEINVSVVRGEFIANSVENINREIIYYQKIFMLKKLVNTTEIDKSKRERYRTLRNKGLIETLPSEDDLSSFAGISEIVDLIKNIDEIFNRSLETVILDDYILSKFNSLLKDDGKTFFRNEVEYILSGSKEDEKNRKRFRRKLVLVRNMINAIIIEKSPKMQAQITSLAGTTGVFAPLTYLGLLEAWALAEAENDVKILENGGKIPIFKGEDDWAVKIENIFEAEDGYIDNKAERGMDYNDYLRVFLFMTSKEKKVKRIMDLIQINTQGNYDKNFTFSGSSTGIDYKVEVDNFEYNWKDSY